MILASLKLLSLLQDLTVNKHFYRHSRDYYYYPHSYLLNETELKFRNGIEYDITMKELKTLHRQLFLFKYESIMP